MPTTFSRKNRHKPAPKNWRKFENGMLMIVIPAATLMIQGWGFQDQALATKLNLFVSTGVVALIKFVGVFMANGEDYVPTKPAENEPA